MAQGSGTLALLEASAAASPLFCGCGSCRLAQERGTVAHWRQRSERNCGHFWAAGKFGEDDAGALEVGSTSRHTRRTRSQNYYFLVQGLKGGGPPSSLRVPNMSQHHRSGTNRLGSYHLGLQYRVSFQACLRRPMLCCKLAGWARAARVGSLPLTCCSRACSGHVPDCAEPSECTFKICGMLGDWFRMA